jgi:hypothetical protein
VFSSKVSGLVCGNSLTSLKLMLVAAIVWQERKWEMWEEGVKLCRA